MTSANSYSSAATALDAVMEAASRGREKTGAPRRAVTLARRVMTAMDEAVETALARWIARPVGSSIDVQRAAKVFRVPVSRGVIPQVIVEAAGLKVQITRSKLDVSARITEYSRVVRALSQVSRRLGVRLTDPQPATLTLILQLPYRVNIASLQPLERSNAYPVVLQGANRAKVVGRDYTAIVYTKTVNIYTRVHKKERLGRILLELITLTAQHGYL